MTVFFAISKLSIFTLFNCPIIGEYYKEPTATQKTDWTTMLLNLINGNYAASATQATALGYELILFSDNTNGETYYILQTISGGINYWGTYILNPAACRNELVIMSVHPKKDANTGHQGIYCFKETDAYFYMLSGTHRCNADLEPGYTYCSGTTTGCSTADPKVSENFRKSDLAHTVNSIWQITTKTIHDNVAGTYFVQLHGFTKLSTDPFVIMSNGTTITPSPDKIVDLRDGLLLADPSLTFEIAHLNLAWTRLRGFSNTNGRTINNLDNSTDPCMDNATMTAGRFLHVEQERTQLRSDETGWHKMAVGLGEAFNANACMSLLPVELTKFTGKVKNEQILLEWTTAQELNLAYFSIEKSARNIDFKEITRIDSEGNSQKEKRYQLEDMPFLGNNFYRLKMVDLDGTERYSDVIQVNYFNENIIQVWAQSGFVPKTN